MAASTEGSAPATCGHVECADGGSESLYTLPNAVTLARTVGALVLAGLAIAGESTPLLLAAVATYWIGDIADGKIARLTGTETRNGAVLDILCDRLCCAVVYVVFAVQHPTLLPAIFVFLLQFMVVDNFLSLAFLRWPVSSPNYFFLVDRTLWRLNWSPLGKSVNSAALLVVMLLTGSVVVSTALASAVLVLKVWSVLRLGRLPVRGLAASCARRSDAAPLGTGAPEAAPRLLSGQRP
jgi:CDP-diacylglycerol---glycerol-3-phosphate 3-phosphatidyltransferase